MSISPRSVSRAGDWMRVALEIAFIAFVIVASPIAALLTPRSELEQALPLFAIVFGGVVLWTAIDLVRVVRAQLGAAPSAPNGPEPTQRDAIWDHAESTDDALHTAIPLAALSISGRIQGDELLSGLVRHLRAVPLGEERSDATRALELAMAATGVSEAPTLFWAPGAGTNAVIAGTSERSVIAIGEAMLASFDPEALLGVFADLLVRLEPGTVRSISSWDPPGLLDNDQRMRPVTAVRIYQAADAQTVLALRDTAPLVSALRLTGQADPFLPGLTPDQAHLMWTWPSVLPPILAETEGELLAMTVALALDDANRSRLEHARIEVIDRVLGAVSGEASLLDC